MGLLLFCFRSFDVEEFLTFLLLDFLFSEMTELEASLLSMLFLYWLWDIAEFELFLETADLPDLLRFELHP